MRTANIVHTGNSTNITTTYFDSGWFNRHPNTTWQYHRTQTDWQNTKHINFGIINKLGIILEEFGGGTYTVREIPVWIKPKQEKEFVEEILSHIMNDKKTEKYQFLDNIAKSLACKKSVKANEYLSQNQVDYILEDLEKCSNPYTCPHGRPIIIKYSKYEIEKWFKRVQ